MKSKLKAILPQRLLRRWQALRQELTYRGTTRDIFSKIYATNAWGGKRGEFCSGDGSTSDNTSKYVEIVSDFIRARNISTILDLGCGDFRVGSQLPGNVIGVDVVPELIERNRHAFPNATFQCLDIIDDPLPTAELCLIRQVFQHLSNDQISKILAKVHSYPFVIVTEHQRKGDLHPNLDKRTGPHIREGAGVHLDEAPFSLKCETLLEVPLSDNEVISTVLLQHLVESQ